MFFVLLSPDVLFVKAKLVIRTLSELRLTVAAPLSEIVILGVAYVIIVGLVRQEPLFSHREI